MATLFHVEVLLLVGITTKKSAMNPVGLCKRGDLEESALEEISWKTCLLGRNEREMTFGAAGELGGFGRIRLCLSSRGTCPDREHANCISVVSLNLEVEKERENLHPCCCLFQLAKERRGLVLGQEAVDRQRLSDEKFNGVSR